MTCKKAPFFVVLVLLFTSFLHGQADARSGIGIPPGTSVDTLKYGDVSGPVVKLKPEEQVAFLFVSAITDLEGKCLNKFFGGPGRLCSLADLVKGVRTNGGILGLSQDPIRDSNYHYSVTIVGQDCLILAVPRRAGLGGFAYVGSPGGMNGDTYFNPGGADMSQAKKLGEMGYSGQGFRR